MPGLDDVADNIDRAEHRAAHTRGQPNHSPAPIADGGDAVQRALDARAVVLAKGADALDNVQDVVARHGIGAEDGLASRIPRLGLPPEIHYDFEEIRPMILLT